MSQIKNKKSAHRARQQKLRGLLLLSGGGLILLIGAVFAFNRPSQPKSPIEVNGVPSLIVDQEEIDLGDVRLGQYVDVSFQLTNVGDQPLRFSEAPYIEVKEGC